MRIGRSSEKTIKVGEHELAWHIYRLPQYCTVDGYKGLTLYVELAQEPQRALIIEFPLKTGIRRNNPILQRPKVSDKDVATVISSAMKAGWNPESRGKPFVFQVSETQEAP
jgi:hypothetical protein